MPSASAWNASPKERCTYGSRLLTLWEIGVASPEERGYKIVDALISEGLGKLGWQGAVGAVAFNQIGGSKSLIKGAELSQRTEDLNRLMSTCHATPYFVFQPTHVIKAGAGIPC
jgi:hypothetical protein